VLSVRVKKDPTDCVPSVPIHAFGVGREIARLGGENVRRDDDDVVEANGEMGGGAGMSRMSTPVGRVMLRFNWVGD